MEYLNHIQLELNWNWRYNLSQESLQLLTSTFQQWLTILVLLLDSVAGVYWLLNSLKDNLLVRGYAMNIAQMPWKTVANHEDGLIFGGHDVDRLVQFFNNGVEDFWHIRYSCDCSAFIFKGTNILYDFIPCLAHHDKVRQLFYESGLRYPLTQNGKEL